MMNISRQEISDGIARRRHFQQIDQRPPPKPPAGETVEQAIARGCRYTVIPTGYQPINLPPGQSTVWRSITANDVARKRAHRTARILPDRCEPEHRMAEHEFDEIVVSLRKTRNKILPRTEAIIRSIIVHGDTWDSACAEHDVAGFEARQMVKRFVTRVAAGERLPADQRMTQTYFDAVIETIAKTSGALPAKSVRVLRRVVVEGYLFQSAATDCRVPIADVRLMVSRFAERVEKMGARNV